MADSLNPLVDKLAEELEDKPDKWFNSPKGWLFKPSFSRSQQDRDADDPNRRTSGAFSGLKALVKGSVGSTYQKRYFILNMERRFLAYYKDDQIGSPESGYIDMSRITDVQLSVISDAPQFAFDLVSAEKYYTLAAESQATMIRWVFAINSCRPQQLSTQISSTANEAEVEHHNSKLIRDKWSRYEYTYQTKGPLMLNVMGTTNKDSKTGKVINNWIIVTSFEPTADGKPGRSESTGVISVKDYLVAVNGMDLMKFNFNEAMDIINRAPFPKTIQFLRDNTGDRQVSRAEGWAVVFYPSLNRKRRRYVDVRWDSINFRKPAPGGSANAQRDAYITLDKVESIKPMIDRTMPLDQQYILRLLCKSGAVVDHVGDDDNSLGSSAVTYIDLCFAKDSQMKNWRSILVSPTIYSNTNDATSIPVQDLEIIESNTANLTKEVTNMAIKSDLTGHFAPRDFTLNTGFLSWTRVGQKMQNGNRHRGMELYNAFGCNLTSVRAVELPAQHRHSNYKFQLILTTEEQVVTIGFKDETSMLRWLEAIKDVIKNAPVKSEDEVYMSVATEKEYVNPGEEEEDMQDLVGNMRSTNLDGNRNGIQGYLYLKSKSMLSTTSNQYRKRHFILHEYILSWYKTASEIDAGVPPQGTVDLRSAYEVRESQDPSAPENSIDIVTNEKIMTMAAVDEADFNLWLDALSDTLEIREMAIQRDGFNGGSKADKAERSLSKEERKAERIAAIRSAVVYAGTLMMKNTKESMFKSSWKERYFVIASGALTYYAEQSDMFDLDKDCKGEITLANIQVVESTNDAKYRSDSIFDVQARVLEGGDSDGMRVFTFDARTPDAAEKWMRELCRATEILEMKKSSRGVLTSTVSEKMVQARNNKRMAMSGGTGVTVIPPAPTVVTSPKQLTEVDDEVCSTNGSNDGTTPSKSIEGSSPNTSHRGVRGAKRGMGRGVDFRGGSSAAAVAFNRQPSFDSFDRQDSYSAPAIEEKAPIQSTYADAYGDTGL